MERKYKLSFDDAESLVFGLVASDGGCCFAACSHGLYRSLDDGETWNALQPLDEVLAITAAALSPCYAQDRSVFAAVMGGILRSSDGGETWFTAGFPAPPPLFTAIAVSPDFERDGVLLACTMEDGVFSSSDRGVHWQPWNFGLFDLHVLCLAFSPDWRDDETVVAGTESGLYRSTNGGRAWRFTDFPADLAPIQSLAWVRDEGSGESFLFAGTEEQGLLRSCDLGTTWEQLPLGAGVNELHARHTDAGGYKLYALVGDGIMVSGDKGESWSALLETESAPTAMRLLGAPERAILLGVQGEGIMKLALP